MKNLFTKPLCLVLCLFTIPIQTKISTSNITTKVSSFFNRRKEEISHQEFNNVARLEIVCHHGPVIIESWKQPCVLLELKKRGNAQFIEQSKLICPKRDQNLSVSVDLPEGSPSGSLSLHVLVPKDLPIKITTTDGSITLKNISGAVDLHTNRGAINVTEGSNTVIAKTMHGNISVQRKKMQPDTALNLYSQHGNITLYVPQDINAQLEAHSLHGKIYSDLFVTLHAQTVLLHEETFKNMRHHVAGWIGQQMQNANPATMLLSADFGVIQINGYDAVKNKKK